MNLCIAGFRALLFLPTHSVRTDRYTSEKRECWPCHSRSATEKRRCNTDDYVAWGDNTLSASQCKRVKDYANDLECSLESLLVFCGSHNCR